MLLRISGVAPIRKIFVIIYTISMSIVRCSLFAFLNEDHRYALSTAVSLKLAWDILSEAPAEESRPKKYYWKMASGLIQGPDFKHEIPAGSMAIEANGQTSWELNRAEWESV